MLLIKGLSTIPSFVPLLLALLLGRPCFYFNYLFRTVNLAISRAEFRGRKFAISFSEYFL